MSQAAAAAPQPQGRPAGAAGVAASPGVATAPEQPASAVQAPAPPAPTPGAARPQSHSHEAAAGTPDLLAARAIPHFLARWRSLVAAALLLSTVLTTAQLVLSWQSLRTASADSAQLIRVQQLKVDLLRADALATNAFLIGGLEPSEQREAYDAALADATTNLTAAASAQPADREALAELSEITVRYAANMELARANNRQGLPVGAAYLKTASNELRGRGMVVVDALVAANSTRAEQALGAQHPLWLSLPPLFTLVVLGLANRWIARRFRRRINAGLLTAGGVVAATLAAAAGLSLLQASENSALRQDAYADMVVGADARSAANAAKSNESLRLIARGSGKAFEEAWRGQSADVLGKAGSGRFSDTKAIWERYAAAHGDLVAKDDAGDWDGAVALATSRTPESATVIFEEFDSSIASGIEGSAATVESTLARRQPWFLTAAALTLLSGLFAMAQAWQGISRRLKEYS